MPGWIAAFKVIPWTEVIAAAPVVVMGARKLWRSVRTRDAGTAAGEGPEARAQALEAQIEELRKELAASSELMTTLAEQNARVVDAIAILRMRTRVLTIACVIMAVTLVGLLAKVAL